MGTTAMGLRRSWRAWLAVALVVALGLVTPVDGLGGATAHDFLLVHPIFPHVHDAQHGHAAQDDTVDRAAMRATIAAPILGPLGATGSGLELAARAMLASGPLALALAGAWVASIGWDRRLDRQHWDVVPTGPPR